MLSKSYVSPNMEDVACRRLETPALCDEMRHRGVSCLKGG